MAYLAFPKELYVDYFLLPIPSFLGYKQPIDINNVIKCYNINSSTKHITMKTLNSTFGRIAIMMIAVFSISAFATRETKNDINLESNAMMIADWQWAKEYTMAYIAAMPESGINLKPTDSVRSFAEQMLHLTSANVGFTAQVTGLPPTIEDVRGLEKNESYKNKAALTELVGKGYDYVIASLEATSNDKLNEEITLFGQFEMTGADAMHKAFIHQNHHRGQTAVYIRLAEGTPAPMKLF